jgi:hypothetical protein
MPTEVLMSFDIESVHCCIVSLWVVIALLPFAFNVATYMEHPSMLDPFSLRIYRHDPYTLTSTRVGRLQPEPTVKVH